MRFLEFFPGRGFLFGRACAFGIRRGKSLLFLLLAAAAIGSFEAGASPCKTALTGSSEEAVQSESGKGKKRSKNKRRRKEAVPREEGSDAVEELIEGAVIGFVVEDLFFD